MKLISKLPPKPSFNLYLLSQPSTTWQHLKESLADSISNNCNSPNTLHYLHAKAISFGLHQNLYICSRLITKYFHFKQTQTPEKILNSLRGNPINKTLVWNSLIKGYLRCGLPRSAINVYNEMILPSCGCDPDEQTIHLAITACTCLCEFELGLEIEENAYSRGLQLDLLIGTALVNMYSKAGDVDTARKVFDEMTQRDVVAWNAVISGYSQVGCVSEAMALFRNMRVVDGIFPTEAGLVSVITSCGDLGLVRNGEIVHSDVIKTGFETNVNVLNSLMALYIAFNHLDLAEKLFGGMVSKDAVSWSTMIGGYVEHERPRDALNLFHWMVTNTRILPTRPILLSMLAACADLGDHQEGTLIKDKYLVNENGELVSDAYLITTLIYMYAKCEQMDIVLQFLDRVVLVREDVVAWNAIIKACAECKQNTWVFELTLAMQRRGIHPDAVTFLALLPIISSIPLPRKGMETHGHVIKRGFESERTIANCHIDMYSRFGNIRGSCKVFNTIQEKDAISWSSMMKAYAWNGSAKEALDLFQQLKRTDIRPNSITFLAVLSACSHAGFVDEGRELFESMEREYGIVPGVEHFTCMLDIFCRAGLLNDAYHLLRISVQKGCTNAVLWGTLLSACRVHSNLVLGEFVAQQIFLMEPNNAANYLMLADIYISAGRRDEANSVLNLLREKRTEKRVGCSWFDAS